MIVNKYNLCITPDDFNAEPIIINQAKWYDIRKTFDNKDIIYWADNNDAQFSIKFKTLTLEKVYTSDTPYKDPILKDEGDKFDITRVNYDDNEKGVKIDFWTTYARRHEIYPDGIIPITMGLFKNWNVYYADGMFNNEKFSTLCDTVDKINKETPNTIGVFKISDDWAIACADISAIEINDSTYNDIINNKI